MAKSADAFRTISEVAELLQVPAHVLRFWESRFTQVKPVKRAGGRRYYRPGDIRLLSGIRLLLHDDGMTIKGVQKILREQGVQHVASLAPALAEIQPDDAPAPASAEVLSFARPGSADPAGPAPEEDAGEDTFEDAIETGDAGPEDTDPYVYEAEAQEAGEAKPYAPVPDEDPAEDAPAPARADPPPEPAQAPQAETPGDPAPQPRAALPPLPDLPDDPPDTAPAPPGALTALAGLRGPLPADLASSLQAIADRLRRPEAGGQTNDRAGD